MQAQKRGRSSSETPGSCECWRHRRRLDVYCCTDQQIICELCAAAEHAGHTIGVVKEERRRKQEEMMSIQNRSKQILLKQEQKWTDEKKTLKLIQDESRKTKDDCESILAGVIDSLQKHYLTLREMIGSQEEVATAHVQTSLRTLTMKMEEVKKRNAEMNRLALTDDAHFLEHWPSLKQLCTEDHLDPPEESSEDPVLLFSHIKRAVEQLGRKLQKLCDAEFASLYQTADRGEQLESGGESEEDLQQTYETDSSASYGSPDQNHTETDQNAEPKTREEFLQYACDLTLDPHTAHDDLVISAGDKEVRLSPQSCKSPGVRYPERFLHRRQVLCKEGLQAERCYYEVEIWGDKMEIALAYKSLDRKSRTNLSAFGANPKSWSLDRSTNYSVSHRGDSVQLTTPPSQKRIGVYLKFREGTLSFYEVSDTMTFLYTAEAEFQEPLYPGFWLGDDCCIRICNL